MSRPEPASQTPVVPLDEVVRFCPSPIGPIEVPSWERERLARCTVPELEALADARPADPCAYEELTRRRGWRVAGPDRAVLLPGTDYWPPR